MSRSPLREWVGGGEAAASPCQSCARGSGQCTAIPAGNSPGHHQELVDLLVDERVVCLPHLGLEFGLVPAILLPCEASNGS